MKTLRKISMVLALATVAFAANWTGSASEPENMKKIDGKAFYVITTAEELAWFAAQINSGKAINGVLAANVTLGTTYAWTPIGKDSTKMFQNIFDGGNFTITTPYTKTGAFAGLFGVIGANGVVKNVKVASPNITHTRNGGAIAGFNNGMINDVIVTGGSVNTTSDSAYSGGIVGRNAGTISNSTNGTSVSNRNSRNSCRDYAPCLNFAGGIVGYNFKKGVLLSNTNNGTVFNSTYQHGVFGRYQSHLYAGGASAYNEGKIDVFFNNGVVKDSLWASSAISYTGGVSGYNIGEINLATNKKDVHTGIRQTKSHDSLFLGGIVAYNRGSLLNSSNTGNVNLLIDSAGASSAYGFLGGLSGYNFNKIKNSMNSGKIASTRIDKSSSTYKQYSYSGGLVGINQGGDALISNSMSVLSSIETKGSFTVQEKGGIAGQNLSSAKITNSYYDQTLLSSVSAPVGTQSATLTYSGGKSTADMKKDQFAWILNTTNGTTANSSAWSRTDGYPIFTTEANKAIYKVVFNDDGVTTNRYTNYKGLVTFPADPEPAEGFLFSGWYNSNDTKVKSTTVFTADQTVNAVYMDASDVFWTINFYNAAPADTLLESKSYQHGSIVTYGGVEPTLTATAKYTYTFKGWDIEPTNAVEDFDYHAVYDSTIRSYTVTFNNTDGSKIESATFEYGKMPSCSKTPTRNATVEWKYSHKGWNPALDYVTENATYTAIYDSSKVEYKVTFMNGTTVIDEQMIPYGEAAVAPTNVTREGYKFVGWNNSFANVTEALTVKALFEELIIRTVNIVNGDGETIDDVNVEDGETYTLPEAPKKDGYTFDAYYDGDMKLGVAGDEISVTANITIIAKYIKNPESSSSAILSSSSKVESSSSSVASTSSSAKSSSSDAKSSSSSAKSSSSATSSSSSKINTSSSAKTDAITANIIPQFLVQVSARTLQVFAARIGAAYALFDMQGRVLLQGRVQTANFEIPVARSGNYIIRIGDTTRRIAVK